MLGMMIGEKLLTWAFFMDQFVYPVGEERWLGYRYFRFHFIREYETLVQHLRNGISILYTV